MLLYISLLYIIVFCTSLWVRSKTREQWLLLRSRAKNWEAGDFGSREPFPYIVFVSFGVSIP